jgi:hypothetical protein
MTIALLLLSLLVVCVPVTGASELDNLDVDINDPAALQEATRVLADEVKLAARPHAYLLIDLAAHAVIMKARGVEMHRLSIARWSAEFREKMTGTFRLISRPAVVRRKMDPSLTSEQEPISLADMPASYHLAFSPPLRIDITAPADRAPVRWALLQVKLWWRWLVQMFHSLSSGPTPQSEPYLLLTLSDDEAQSLAWSLVDGMPVVIRRPTER